MTHYIIDSKKRQEYLYLLLSFLVVSFGLGYTVGYLHGTPATPSEENVATIQQQDDTPATVEISPAIQTAQTPADNEGVATASKPVTPQRVIEQTTTKASKQEPIKQAKAADTAKPAAAKPTKSVELATRHPPATAAISSVKPESVADSDNNDADIQTGDDLSTAQADQDPAEEDPSQYLVQVGLFSSNENAAAFVEQLEESGFDAFISTSGSDKFNVRLGPYSDKNIAQQQMDEFSKSHDSSAYILTRK